jgi:hypothetical protein
MSFFISLSLREEFKKFKMVAVQGLEPRTLRI